MPGRSLFTAAAARESRMGKRMPLQLFDECLLDLPADCSQTAFVLPANERYFPTLAAWPDDIRIAMEEAAHVWLKKYPNRRVLATTAAVLDPGTGLACILHLHWIEKPAVADAPSPAVSNPPEGKP